MKALTPGPSLFLFCLAAYLLSMGGHLYSADDEVKALVTEGIVEHQSVALPTFNMIYMSVGVDGQSFSPFPIGSSLTMIPFYVIGDALSGLFPSLPRPIILEFCYSLVNPLATAVTAFLFFSLCRFLTYSVRTSLLTTLVFAFCSIAWPYAKTAWSEPQATLGVLLGLYGVVRYAKGGELRWLASGGAGLAYACITKYEMGLYVFGCCYLLLHHLAYQKQELMRRRILALLAYGAPLAVGAFIVLGYNYVRFGGWTLFGNYVQDIAIQADQSNPILDSLEGIVVGVYQHLFSTGKGILLFSPPLILFYWAVKLFYRERRDLALLSVGLAAAFLVIAGAFWAMSNVAWGDRYFVSLTPFLVLPLASLVRSLADVGSAYMKRSFVTLCLIGIGIQLLGVSINFQTVIDRQLANGEKPDLQVRSYDPEYSPVLLHLKEVFHRGGDTWDLIRSGRKPFLEDKLRQSGIEMAGTVDQKAYRDVIRYHTYDYWFCYMYLTGLPAYMILAPMALLLLTLVLSGRRLIQILYQSEGSETERPISPSASEPARV